MRISSILRALAVAATLSVPLAQTAMAGQQQQQAAVSHSSTAGNSSIGGAYDNNSLMAPSVGD